MSRIVDNAIGERGAGGGGTHTYMRWCERGVRGGGGEHRDWKGEGSLFFFFFFFAPFFFHRQ